MAELNASNNPLTADGTYTFEIVPGVHYVLGAAGTWGGGSLAIGWQDEDGNVTAFDESPLTANASFSFVVAAGIVSMTLTGSTGASIRIQTADAPGAETTDSLLAKLQGAEADSTRIGAEYMPEIIPVDGLTLSDTSGIEMPLNTLGVNASNELVLHDNETTGGLPVVGRVLRGLLNYTVSDNLSADVYVEIARCVIPASLLANGDPLAITGTVFVRSQLTNYAPGGDPAVQFRLLKADGNPNNNAVASSGYRAVIKTAATPAELTTFSFNSILFASVSASLLALTMTSSGGVRRREVTAGVPTDTYIDIGTFGAANARNVPYGGAGQFAYLSVGIYLPADAATADATGSITIASDLLVTV